VIVINVVDLVALGLACLIGLALAPVLLVRAWEVRKQRMSMTDYERAYGRRPDQ
jgi:hypothetical protein